MKNRIYANFKHILVIKKKNHISSTIYTW